MYSAFWHAVVKPGKKQDFLDFLKWDADVAKDSEPATISFDVFEDPENPDAVYVYEAYKSEDGFAEHRKNEPFQRFRNEVRPEWLTDLRLIMPFANSVVSKG